MSIALALAQSSTLDAEAGGLHWRVRRVASADLVEAGGSLILAARRKVDGEAADAATPAQIRDGMRFFDAVLAAGLVGASTDGVAWEELRVVLDPKLENPSAGRVHVSSLPPGVGPTLAQTILDLSQDGGAAGARLAGFLGGKSDPPRRARK